MGPAPQQATGAHVSPGDGLEDLLKKLNKSWDYLFKKRCIVFIVINLLIIVWAFDYNLH